MKRRIITIVLFLIASYTMAQEKSYEDNFGEVKMFFKIGLIENSNQYFFISALENYEMKLNIGQKSSDLERMQEAAFRIVNCDKCHLIKSKKLMDPMAFVLKNIKQKDVFLIYKEKEDYKVELYREK
ncbi:MAG: hypothetical protein DWP98_08985 [Bacteroidetes bacterium]|nr:MAG: hypothetical protein DWP98_08985 [Bacteroidota bacterium]MBL1145989.1 hypothetical protein [Bacteroidota bacterium]NOG58783.1 hypothetical protein [Bacteroidota bacterium]